MGTVAIESLLAAHVELESQNRELGNRAESITTRAAFASLGSKPMFFGQSLGWAVELRTHRLLAESATVYANERFEGSFFTKSEVSKYRTIFSYALEENDAQIAADEGGVRDRDGSFETYGVEFRNYSDSFFLRPDDVVTFRGSVTRRSEPTEGAEVRFRGTTQYADVWVPSKRCKSGKPSWMLRGAASYTWGELAASGRSDNYAVVQASFSKYFKRPKWEFLVGASHEAQDPGIPGLDWKRTTFWAGFGFGHDSTRSAHGTGLWNTLTVPTLSSSSGTGSGAGPQRPRV